ncbi:MAG TPA: formate dehydrogenase accessory sulfurtransferase FdhD [Smithella sp.]|nr:formate dehydrogenase accessory sulfurtransferase FdhD [Smithella sp.]
MNDFQKIIKTIRCFSGSYSAVSGSRVKVIQEVMITVRVNKTPLANIACAGIHLEELAAGFLRSEKIITRRQDIENISLAKNRVDVLLKNKNFFPDVSVKNIASSGARGRSNVALLTPLNVPAGLSINTALALKLMDDLLNGSAMHNETGGTHCSALAFRKKIAALREDIGRHNTIDMLGGYALLNKLNLHRAIILTTGRISSEIVYKIWNMGVPFIISHSAPTANAVTLAKQANITLIGYVRKGRMSIYSHERRVII